MRTCLYAAAFVTLAGCSSGDKVNWPDLYSVKGTVTNGSKSVTGGNLLFRMTDGSADYLVSGNVESDGSFTLHTSHAQERGAGRKPGAPAGKYRVMYTPLNVDQTAGGSNDPVDLPNPVTIEAKDNELKLDLAKKR